MKAQRPYLLRAMYEWICDSDEIPHLLIDASVEGVVVPQEFVEDNQIVLNIGINAIRDLQLGEDFVMFSSRFDGRAMEIVLPIASVKAIYCKDSGEGMALTAETLAAPTVGHGTEQVGRAQLKNDTAPQDPKNSNKPGDDSPDDKPTLRLV